MSERTVFERIYSGELPACEVYRNDTYGILAFLDQYPATEGHMLVIPKEPIDKYAQLPASRALQLQLVAHALMVRAEEVLPGIERATTLVSGFAVPHVHIHVLPSYTRGDVQKVFDAERTRNLGSRADDEGLKVLADKLALTAAAKRKLDNGVAYIDLVKQF